MGKKIRKMGKVLSSSTPYSKFLRIFFRECMLKSGDAAVAASIDGAMCQLINIRCISTLYRQEVL